MEDGFAVLEWEGDLLGRFRLKSVAGNMLVEVGACIFGIVVRYGFLDFLDFTDLLELMEEVEVFRKLGYYR